MTPITKAIFPVAGLGTRLFPATKASPKEMLTVVDKPLIQYAVEEAIGAGIKELIFIINANKTVIQEHFSQEARMPHYVLDILPDGINCTYIKQSQPLGLGHAILCAEHFIHDEPFAVILPDDLLYHPTSSGLKELLAVYAHYPHPLLTVQAIAHDKLSHYGIINPKYEPTLLTQGLYPVLGIVEKPIPRLAPSHLGVIGRYILHPEIFSCLKKIDYDHQGELQLTQAIAMLVGQSPVYAHTFTGQRYDCGSKLGYLEATLAYAAIHPELHEDFKLLVRKYSG
jgi:UTP--glucose-1-phosphate uridylyltransferase